MRRADRTLERTRQGRQAHLLPRGQRRGAAPNRHPRTLRQGLRHRHQRHDEARARGAFQRPGSRVRRTLQRRGVGGESAADPQVLPRRRAEESHAQHDPRRGQAPGRTAHGRNPPHLVRSGLPARSARLGDLHPRRDPVAHERDARHEARRKGQGRSAGAGNRAVRAAL